MIELKNISKFYNPGDVSEICLFKNFNLNIEDHSFVSIVGTNGSGKTSLLNIICGSIPIDSGNIIIDGEDITKKPEYLRMKNIGRVYQNPSLGTCASMNIIENMALADNKVSGYNLTKLVNKDRVDYYKELLRSLNLGLEDRCDVPMGLLSGGQRQAVAMLMVTLNPIDFLILDEHTAALDPKTSDIIMELTRKIVKEKQLTSIMVTHNLRYSIEYGDRLLMFHEGAVVLDKKGQEKASLKIEDVLGQFTQISVECGN